MGINAPLTEGHSFFGERQPRRFNPDSREAPNPGKGRLSLVEGHSAISLPHVEASGTEQAEIVEKSVQAIPPVQESDDRGYSEVEILLRTSPPELYYRMGDVF